MENFGVVDSRYESTFLRGYKTHPTWLIAIGQSEFLAVFSNAKIPSLFLITILSIATLPLRRLYREESPITHQKPSPLVPNTKHCDDCTGTDRPITTHSDRRYNQSTNPPPDAARTIKELLIQEIDSTPDELLADLLSLVRSLKSTLNPQLNTYEQLLKRIDYLEAIIGIRKGLESFDRGEGIPAERAMTALQQQFNIPPSL
ncbi:hypothetical protein [Microcoleus sp. Pol12B4]|uniref:hypothetical protein n=1 Tax=Microcoleus sp. Pol12B4 TaxID=3055395 RepID=UPI002FD5F0A0